MLRLLHIRNLGLLEDVTLEFGAGLTVFTGETGAGKSMILDALSLLCGRRASPSLVRSGCEKAGVEAVFEYPAQGAVARWLEENGLESEADGGELILRREVSAGGRGRAWINGQLVPLSQLADLSGHLLDLHDQNEQLSLLSPEVLRDFYDRFSGLEKRRAAVAEAHEAWREAHTGLEKHRAAGMDREQRRDFLKFQVEELRALGLSSGELTQLDEEKQRLSHVEELRENGTGLLRLLHEAEGEERSALDLLYSAQALLEKMAARDGSLAGASERMAQAVEQTRELACELAGYVGDLEGNPERYAEVEERLHALRRALRKHGGTEEAALERFRELEAELDRLEHWEAEHGEWMERVEAARKRLAAAAADLTRDRRRARAAFLRPLAALLKDFAIPDARVDIEFVPRTRGVELAGGNATGSAGFCGPEGAEEVELLFSANPGEALQPLRKVASGGELSRVMLALRSLSAEQQEVPVLVFDEIDSGISGGAVRRVSERLAALGERHQVLYVTHQPAIASVAHRHLVVEKRVRKGRTETCVLEMHGEKRRRELARLLDGGLESERSLALAAEMLDCGGD